MRALYLALGLSAVQPCTDLLAKESYFYLVAPIERATSGISPGILTGPYLNVDTAKTNPALQSALQALDDRDQLTRDQIDLVVSAIKAANDDLDLQPYLEQQMGYSLALVRSWTDSHVRRTTLQRGFKKYSDAKVKIARTTVGWTTIGLGAGTGLMALPLGLTGVGFLPAMALADVGASLVATGAKILNGEVASASVERSMPDLMIMMLGAEEAVPGTRVDWKNATFAPIEELQKRLRPAVLLQKAIAGLGTTELAKISKNDQPLVTVAQDMFARNVVIGTMLLSVLSREADEGRHLRPTADLIAALPEEALVPLAAMAREMSTSPDSLLGIPNYVSDGARNDRRKEVLHYARWMQAALIVRSSNREEIDGSDINTSVEDLLGDDAFFNRFDDARAAQKIETARMGNVEARRIGIFFETFRRGPRR